MYLNSEAMYVKVDGAQPERSLNSRALKVGLLVLAGAGLVVLSVVALSAGTSAVDSAQPTNLFGITSSLRKSSPVASQTISQLAQLPGPSPWKELALAGIEANNRCDRDVSMNANIRNIISGMSSENKAIVARADQEAISKMTDLKAGQTLPFGFWDPLGLSANLPEGRLLFYREAELKHGRVCMLASLGFLVGENFHPLFGGNIDVPSYVAFQASPLQAFWVAVALAVAIPEFRYSVPTFDAPADGGAYKDTDTWSMKPGRVPGDLGYDPLGLKPKDPKAFLEMQNKEINNGRLAMIGIAGMVAQELVTGQKIPLR